MDINISIKPKMRPIVQSKVGAQILELGFTWMCYHDQSKTFGFGTTQEEAHTDWLRVCGETAVARSSGAGSYETPTDLCST